MAEHAENRQAAVNRMRAITVSREYGSGGGEIASRLAERLGWQLVDHEVVASVAQDLGVSLDAAEAHDERTESFIERVLSNLQSAEPSLIVDQESIPIDSRDYAHALTRVVQAAARNGHAVIVGRGGQAILTGAPDVLHLRVVAPLDARVAYVARREGLSGDDARHRVLEKDRARAQYLSELYHWDARDPHHYDLMLNTAVLSLDQCVDITITALAAKAARLGLPAEALGPGADVSRYPDQPEDLPAPPAADDTGTPGGTPPHA